MTTTHSPVGDVQKESVDADSGVQRDTSYASQPHDNASNLSVNYQPPQLRQAVQLQKARGNQYVQRILASGSTVDKRVPISRSPSNQVLLRQIRRKAADASSLHVNTPGDIYEQEANQVAEKVMRMSDSTAPVIEHNLTSEGAPEAPPSVHHALHSSGHPLDASVRAMMEPRFGYDFSDVSAHTDLLAAQSARNIRARAYTVGNDIVFGAGEYKPSSDAGRQLIAHELAHVVQQSTGQLRLSRQPVDTPAVSSVAQAVAEALNRPDPIAGVGDFPAAFNLLNAQSMPVMLQTLNELATQQLLDVLIGGAGQVQGVNMPRILAATQLIRFVKTNAAQTQQSDLESFSNNAQTLPSDQLNDMLNFINASGRVDPTTREGLMAMVLGEMAGPSARGLTPAVEGAVSGPVGPGPWAPPGAQPIPFYIGNQAHIGIAATYIAVHPGEPVFTNFIPLSTILQDAGTLGLTPNAGALSAADLALKPDILNLAPSRRHLYEIKPTSQQSLGRAEAQMYVGLLAAVGIPVTLGPIGEPGTAGIIPAPGGVYIFETPDTGVIVYQYRRMRLVEVPVPSTETQTERRRFRLEPLTQQEAATIAAGIGIAAMLVAAMWWLIRALAVAGALAGG